MTQNRSMPPGTIIPELAYADVDAAAAWLCNTFGFTERMRIANHRRQLVYRDESIIVVAYRGENMPNLSDVVVTAPFTHSILMCVENIDQHFERVKGRGAKVLTSPQTYPFGERQYTVEDIGGHEWTFTESCSDISPEEWGGLLVKDQ
jgi:uncharacterized glyoxalase superfamily protein PhnB